MLYTAPPYLPKSLVCCGDTAGAAIAYNLKKLMKQATKKGAGRCKSNTEKPASLFFEPNWQH
ncbi:MAG: hypothetical protein ACXVNN_08085 [Bacteroidia bacterium]